MLSKLKQDLQKLKNPKKAKILQGFFKTGKGEYSEGDIFLGIVVPLQRKVSRKYQTLKLTDLKRLAYLEDERTKQLSLADVSDIFPPLNTVKQEIDRYSETMQNNKGHFQNGINWAFNYVAKKVNK